MPKTKISEFSATPGNNTDIDGINIAEGCAPSGINDAIRELMAQLKDFQAGTAGDSFNGPIGTTTPAAGTFTNLSASGTFALTGDQVQISEGGTGQTTANAAFNALAPSQSTHAGKYLKTDGTNTSWDAIEINTADITGTLPIANGGTGLTALGTGVQTALGIAVGSSGAFVVNGGALGTPSSGTVTNLTGTASININGTVGATTPTTGAFTTLSASGNITVSGGTANGVAYLNGSKVLTTGGTLTFDGTTLRTGTSSTASPGVKVNMDGVGTQTYFALTSDPLTIFSIYRPSGANNLRFDANYGGFVWGLGSAGTATEAMALTSTGLGIGTSSPAAKLDVQGASSDQIRVRTAGTEFYRFGRNASTGFLDFYGSQTGYQGYTFGGVDGTWMTINASGNLGLGVTPSAWNSGWRALQIGALSNFVNNGSGNTTDVWHNGYVDTGGNVRYLTTAAASFYRLEGNTFKWFNAPSGTAGNAISFTQALTLNANGALVLQGGNTSASGVGVAFPATQSASSDANTLDDYEEGTWTPTLNFGGATTGITYSDRAGYYIKIGRLVEIQFAFTLTSKGSATGNATITGLPFATMSSPYISARSGGVCTSVGNIATTFNALGASIDHTSSTLNLVKVSSAPTNVADTDFTNTTVIYNLTVTYVTGS